MGVSTLERSPGWLQWIREGFGMFSSFTRIEPPNSSRAIFSPGELDHIRTVCTSHMLEGKNRLPRQAFLVTLREVRGFDKVKEKQVDYAIRQVGVRESEDISIDDFIEVRTSW
jgi:hypothetical protein